MFTYTRNRYSVPLKKVKKKIKSNKKRKKETKKNKVELSSALDFLSCTIL